MHTYSYSQTGNQKKVVFSILLTSFWVFGGLIVAFILFGPDSGLGLTAIIINSVVAISTLVYYTRKYVLEKITITLHEHSFSVHFSNLDETIFFTKSDIKKIKMGEYHLSTIGKHYVWIWMNNPRYNLFIENHTDEINLPFEEFVKAFIHFLEKEKDDATKYE